MKEVRCVGFGCRRAVCGWFVAVVAVVAAGWGGAGVAVAEDIPRAVDHMMDEAGLVEATLTGG